MFAKCVIFIRKNVDQIEINKFKQKENNILNITIVRQNK